MAKPNYSFQKRQKELAKKQKKEEKRLKKAGAKEETETNPGDPQASAALPPVDDTTVA